MPADRVLARHSSDPAPAQLAAPAPGPAVAEADDRHAAVSAPRDRKPAMRAALIGLGALSVLGIVLAAVSVVAWYVAAVPVVLLVAYIAGLRRAELARRARLAERAEHEDVERDERPLGRALVQPRTPTAPEAEGSRTERQDVDETVSPKADDGSSAAEPVDTSRVVERLRAGEWVPLPVPRPTYALRGDVDDLATRHRAHNAALGLGQALESETVEEDEAVAEQVEGMEPAASLDLDEILARRRGA